MIVEAIIAVAMVVVYWYFNMRMNIRHSSLPMGTILEASSREWDFVVIGAGASGAAAVAAIRDADRSATVLVVESGRVNDGSMVQLPNYTFDLVGSEVDWLLRAARPFAEEVPASPIGTLPISSCDALTAPPSGQPHLDGVRNAKQGMKPYPRGKGIGGTQQLDHQLWFSPAMTSDVKGKRLEAQSSLWLSTFLSSYRLLSLPVMRSPISALFGEAAKVHHRIAPFLPPAPTDAATMDVPLMKTDHVFPHYLLVESQYGTRPNVARYIFDSVLNKGGAEHSSIGVTTACTVVGFKCTPADSGNSPTKRLVVSGVLCRNAGLVDDCAPPVEIKVKRGVICCAGNFGSAKVLAPLLCGRLARSTGSKTAISFPLVDVVSVPLIYQAKPGLTDDPSRTQSFKNIFAWYVARKGGLLQVVTDTSILLASKEVPGASMLISLFPCGGGYASHRQRMAKMGFAPVLGVFQEAFHFNIAIHALPGVERIARFQFSSSSTPAGQELHGGLTFSPLDEEVAERVSQLLVEGILFCREMVLLSPLCALTTKKEALDTSLFPPSESSAIFQVLYGSKALVKRAAPAEGKQEALRQRALELATSSDYLEAYVRKHARYAGYASGALSSYVDVGCSSRLDSATGCPGNVFIGDVSTWSPGFGLSGGIHNAGATSTAMHRGYIAGLEAVEETRLA